MISKIKRFFKLRLDVFTIYRDNRSRYALLYESSSYICTKVNNKFQCYNLKNLYGMQKKFT